MECVVCVSDVSPPPHPSYLHISKERVEQDFSSLFFISFLYLHSHIAMTADIIDGEGYSVSSSSTQHVPELVDSRSSSSDISIKKKKQHRRRTIEIDGDADSDKDLVISTLTESLQMHKEIMEELQREKDAFVADLKREREEEKQANRKEKEDALESMEAQLQRYRQLEEAYSLVVNELEAKKNEYRRMETSFYEHVKR